MGISCCYIANERNKCFDFQNEAFDFINSSIDSLKIKKLKFKYIYKCIVDEDFDHKNFLKQVDSINNIDYKNLILKENSNFYDCDEKLNPNYKIHKNIFSIISFTLMDNNYHIRIDILLSYLLCFALDDYKDKINYFIILNRKLLFGVNSNKKGNLKSLILNYLNFFINTITNSFYRIITNELSRNPHLVFDLNLLITMCTEKKIEIFYEGFFQKHFDSLSDNFDEKELNEFFVKNAYVFDIIDLRNTYFNCKNSDFSF